MKIKRFFASDIRQAMRMVKEELGADAVIMSNRSVDGGVEIVAARDFDEQLIHSKLEKEAAERKAKRPEVKEPALQDFTADTQPVHIVSSARKKGADGSIPPRSTRRDFDEYLGYAEKLQINRSRRPQSETIKKAETFKSVQAESIPDEVPPQAPVMPVQEPPLVSKPSVEPVVEMRQESSSDQLIKDMFQELKALRMTMNCRLSEIGWRQNSQSNPVRVELLHRLVDMGIAKNLSMKIAGRLSNYQTIEPAFKKAQDMLVNVLPVVNDTLLDYGGIAALVGPTGVGKTTTIAKLAAQFILKHGPRQVALITTDNYRIAAHDQLNTYGRILDVPVRVAADAEQLRNVIDSFADKRLILIDTAGMSQRDQRLAEQIQTLQQDDLRIRPYLVMSAATQYKALKEIIKAFQIFQPEASILTKLDEAATKGAAISALIEQRLPLSFVTDGQQVPEDLHDASARKLIEQCVAELDQESDYNAILDYDDWAAHGYA
ncbi:MAG: flagellar biosynthesis protein FlhF [Methylomicrobium sp.]